MRVFGASEDKILGSFVAEVQRVASRRLGSSGSAPSDSACGKTLMGTGNHVDGLGRCD